MDIKNSISKWILGKYSFVGLPNSKSQLSDFSETKQDFAQVIFTNIIELVTDIANDVTLSLKKGDAMRFAEFNLFFENNAQIVLNELFNKGISVIAYNDEGFVKVDPTDYSINSKNKVELNKHHYPNHTIYVMQSDSFRVNGMSDRQFLAGFLKYLDNVLNASNTTTARLGTLIMASPKAQSGLPMVAKLTDGDKQKAEEDISNDYGGLKKQKQILIWRQGMDFTTINLSGLDSRTIEKSKFAVSVICDRLKIQSNQVSTMESSSSGNGLSNGGEIQEGDILRYKTFERLLNKTFIKMARDLDLIVDYTIYNKPKLKQDGVILQEGGTATQSIQEVSLNGAQISGLLEILTSVSLGVVGKEAAINIIISAFPQIAQDEASKMVDGVIVGAAVQQTARF